MIRAGVPEPPRMVIEQVTDPVEVARFQAQDDCHRRNSAWLQAHWGDLLPQARGKFLAVANQEAFVANSPKEAWDWVSTRHSQDRGALVRFIRTEPGPRIYANLG